MCMRHMIPQSSNRALLGIPVSCRQLTTCLFVRHEISTFVFIETDRYSSLKYPQSTQNLSVGSATPVKTGCIRCPIKSQLSRWVVLAIQQNFGRSQMYKSKYGDFFRYFVSANDYVHGSRSFGWESWCLLIDFLTKPLELSEVLQ